MSTCEWVFPAHAGMNRVLHLLCPTRLCVPRTRGDEPKLVGDGFTEGECSPHTRG